MLIRRINSISLPLGLLLLAFVWGMTPGLAQNADDSNKTAQVNQALNATEASLSPSPAAPSSESQGPVSPEVSSLSNEVAASVSQGVPSSLPSAPEARSLGSRPTVAPQASAPPASQNAPGGTPVYPSATPASSQASSKPPESLFKITGEARAAMGINSNGEAIFNRANADLNEKNYKVISSSALNHNINTYDPAIFSRLKVVVDASVAQAVVSAHLNVTIDPWSYVGRSNARLVTGVGGDTAKVQYIYWGNTGYTLNTRVNTLKNGDTFALPEVKVIHGNVVPATTVTSAYSNIFHIPAAKITTVFQPVREVWVDLKPSDRVKLRIFPLAYEDQALTSDDPLKLSNNKEWWAQSPWIDGWQQGNLNTGASPVSFRQGQWDKSLSFFTRDSDYQRLTALRGASLDFSPTDDTSWQTTFASPKTLWQDYAEINTIEASSRLKQFIGEFLYIGAVANAHQGFANGDTDAENYSGGVDSAAMLLRGVKLNTEYAFSRSVYDRTQLGYQTKFSGNAYYAGLEYSSNEEGMINKDWYNYLPEEKTDPFFKARFYFSRMDPGFESSLSDYNSTQSDSFWADHLTFYPSEYRYLPGVVAPMSQYDLEPFAIGTGINYGQEVWAWRGETHLLEDKLHGLLDIRHVTNDDSRNIETVSRTEWTLHMPDKLTTKLLFVSHDLPKTTGGVDPFNVVDNTGNPILGNTGPEKDLNSTIVGGKKPSLKTGSLGARYELTPWAAISGVWEYTNDVNLGTGEYPQGILNDRSFANINANGRIYENPITFLYSQGNFKQAPYPYYNIFKTGLELVPTDKWHIYLDYTRNPNEFAGNIDDNMNHYGIETSFVPTPKIGFFARYTYSQGYDINRLVNDGHLSYRDYQSFFFEARMLLPKDILFSIQYGVGPVYSLQTVVTDPALTYYSNTALQTQHMVRIVFDKKF